MTTFEPVRTVEDLLILSLDEVQEGYRDGAAGEPEPGNNRSRAYWHGWRVGCMNTGRLETDEDMRALAHDSLRGGRMDPRLLDRGRADPR